MTDAHKIVNKILELEDPDDSFLDSFIDLVDLGQLRNALHSVGLYLYSSTPQFYKWLIFMGGAYWEDDKLRGKAKISYFEGQLAAAMRNLCIHQYRARVWINDVADGAYPKEPIQIVFAGPPHYFTPDLIEQVQNANERPNSGLTTACDWILKAKIQRV